MVAGVRGGGWGDGGGGEGVYRINGLVAALLKVLRGRPSVLFPVKPKACLVVAE